MTLTDPRSLTAHSRDMIVEQCMALVGRSSERPITYRKWLEAQSDESLADHYKIVQEKLGI